MHAVLCIATAPHKRNNAKVQQNSLRRLLSFVTIVGRSVGVQFILKLSLVIVVANAIFVSV